MYDRSWTRRPFSRSFAERRSSMSAACRSCARASRVSPSPTSPNPRPIRALATFRCNIMFVASAPFFVAVLRLRRVPSWQPCGSAWERSAECSARAMCPLRISSPTPVSHEARNELLRCIAPRGVRVIACARLKTSDEIILVESNGLVSPLLGQS